MLSCTPARVGASRLRKAPRPEQTFNNRANLATSQEHTTSRYVESLPLILLGQQDHVVVGNPPSIT